MSNQITGIFSKDGLPVGLYTTSGALVAGARANTRPSRSFSYTPDGLDAPIYEEAAFTLTQGKEVTLGAVAAWSDKSRLLLTGLLPAGGSSEYVQQSLGPSGSAVWAVECLYSGHRLELALNATNPAAQYRVWVDGAPAPTQSIGTVGPFVAKIQMPAKEGLRRILVEMRYLDLSKVGHEAGTTLASPPAKKAKLLVIGDSYVQGLDYMVPGDSTRHKHLDPFAPSLRHLLPDLDVYHHGFGGTGYYQQYPALHYAAASRLDAHAKVRPDYAIVFGSQNDGGIEGSTERQAIFREQAQKLFAELGAYARIFVVGASPYGRDSSDGLLQELAGSMPRMLGAVFPRADGWFPGKEDGVYHWDAHPTLVGHYEYAKKIAQAVHPLLGK